MKQGLAAGLTIALVLLIIVGLNMQPSGKKDDISIEDIPKPQVASMGAGGGSSADMAKVDKNYQPTVMGSPLKPIKAKDIEILSVEDAKSVNDNDLVLGVAINGEARAYPIAMLCGPTREIINDDLGGEKIAATW